MVDLMAQLKYDMDVMFQQPKVEPMKAEEFVRLLNGNFPYLLDYVLDKDNTTTASRSYMVSQQPSYLTFLVMDGLLKDREFYDTHYDSDLGDIDLTKAYQFIVNNQHMHNMWML